MSIYVNIGHNPSDVDKIKQTIEVLNFVNNIHNKEDAGITDDQVSDLLEWHTSLANLLIHFTPSVDD